MKTPSWGAGVAVVVVGWLVTSCGGDAAPEVERGRPVEVVLLRSTNPARVDALPGLVTAYRRTQLAFEVSGRLTRVPTVGETVEGPAYGADGTLKRPGDVVAVVDDARYRRQLAALEARMASVEAGLQALRIQRQDTAPRDLESANSRLARAKLGTRSVQEDLDAARTSARLAGEEYQRLQGLRAAGAASQAELEQAEGAVAEADARVARLEVSSDEQSQLVGEAESAVRQAESALELLDAELASATAQLEELGIQVDQAREDVADCVLRAPFGGQITLVNLADGSAVRAAEPVAELALMEPARVEVAVSPETQRRLPKRTQVELVPRGDTVPSDLELLGIVYERGVGDPLTGTFHVGVVALNPVVELQPVDPAHADAPRITDVFPVFRRGIDDRLFVHADCLLEQDDGFVVLRFGRALRGTSNDSLGHLVRPEAVPVTLADHYETISEFRLQEIVDEGRLTPSDVLVVSPRPEHVEGVVLTETRRALQPGDVVSVVVRTGERPPGFYAPVSAICERDGETSVFVVDGDRATRRAVTVHESWGSLRRIEGEGVADGARLVTTGAHFLADGDRVSVQSERELEPGRGGAQ